MTIPRDLLDRTLFELTTIASPIGEERALCDAVAERLAKLALPAPIRRYGDSIVVPLRRNSGGPHIGLCGHLDTVRTENGPARLEGGRCHGSGSSDMKSGLAIMIALAETLDFEKIAADVTLCFYAREEGPFLENELGPVLAKDPELGRVDLAVCLEPSDNRLQLGCTGSIHATVTFEGRTAHSARPWEGENAITKAASFLAEVGAKVAEETLIDGLTYRTVTTITQAKDGGRGRNVVPDRFVLNLNHRFAPTHTLEQAQANVRALVGDRATMEFTDLSPAAMPHRHHPLVEALISAGVVAVERKQAWTDVARFAALGVPAVNLGPGENAQAHQKNESTSLALLHDGYALFQRFFERL
ncbi:succinyl-diaminopimelate desuccinylase [soil metagenome]